MGKIYKNGIQYSGTTDAATNINYDNSKGAIKAGNVQGAIDEIMETTSQSRTLTQAEYDTLPDTKYTDNIEYFITDAEPLDASTIAYDNTTSKMTATNVQAGIDEICTRLKQSGASEALTLLDDKFSVNKSYSKGDSCIYNDYLWKFTSDKPAGEWDSSVVEQCRIMDFIDDVNNDLTQNINSIQSQIVPTASIESGETASKAYSVGDFLVKDGTLYKVTNAIVKGDALTVGTNIAMTTVSSELSSIKSNSTDKWTFKKLTGTDNNVTVPSGVKEFYLSGVNSYNNSSNAITIPIELFNYDEILRFYSYVDATQNVYIKRTSTENMYLVHNKGFSFVIFGYR